MKRTDNFKEAPLGTAVMQACSICGAYMPSVLLKMRGPSSDKVRYTGPMRVAIPDQHCEFCAFVGMYKSSEKYAGRLAAGKIVEGAERKLVAFVPFLEDEETKAIRVGEEMVPRAHGLVIRAEKDGEGMRLVEVLERGNPCDAVKEDANEAG